MTTVNSSMQGKICMVTGANSGIGVTPATIVAAERKAGALVGKSLGETAPLLIFRATVDQFACWATMWSGRVDIHRRYTITSRFL